MTERLWIEVLGDDARSVELPASGRLIIGSSRRRAGLVLDGDGVARTHCGIGRLKDGGWAVKDLGSREGTLLNGQRVDSHRLATGDTLTLGSRRLRLASSPKPAPDAGRRPAEDGAARIGGYRIERLIGKGAMGRVFLAVQESLSRPVALKVLSPELAGDADFVARFEREARAAAALNHPNVVVVHDVGEADGQHYLSMEYMEGGSLEQRVSAAGRLPWREVLDVLHDAANGLVFAEERGVVHRDIKPANLMLTSIGTVKIADLGLAVQGDAERESKVYGTPHFIAPEQARGGAVDHRADLYSLGATAYRLLAGRTAFEGDSTRAILRAHFTETPRPLREELADLPPELDALVLRLLAKDPADRFSSASELLAAVDRLRLASGPAGPVGGPPPKRSLLPVLAGVSVVLVVSALAVLLYLGRELEGESEPVARAERAGEAPALGTASPSLEPDGSFFEGQPEETVDPFEVVERDLEILDLEARLAYRDLPPRAERAARIEGLRALVRRFGATDTAKRASAEIRELESAAAQLRAAEARVESQAQAAGEELRAFVPWPPPEGTLPRPAEALMRVHAFLPPVALRGHVAFADERTRLENEVVAGSLAALRDELARADAFAQRGDFESVASVLDGLLERYDLSGLELPRPPLGMGELRAAIAEVAARRDRLDAAAAAWHREQGRREQARIASVLGVESGFLGELEALDVPSLRARIERLDGLYTDEARALVAFLDESLGATERAFDLLARELEGGGWRRRTVIDPRGGDAWRADGTSDAGLRVSDDGGAGRTLPWSAFGTSPDALQHLFHGRLQRSYAPAELRDVASLSLLVAITATARGSLEAFAGRRPPDVAELFRGPADWLDELRETDAPQGPHARLARERAAAEEVRALSLRASAGDWSHVVARTEKLLAGYGDTLLVALLSDGSDWRE